MNCVFKTQQCWCKNRVVAFDHLKISHDNYCPVIEAHVTRCLNSLGGLGVFQGIFSLNKINLGLFRPTTGHKGHSALCRLLVWGTVLILFIHKKRSFPPWPPKIEKSKKAQVHCINSVFIIHTQCVHISHIFKSALIYDANKM